MKLCSSCSRENRDEANFCDSCGAPLAAVCSNCGYENAPSANFCNNCGQKITKAETPVPMKPLSTAFTSASTPVEKAPPINHIRQTAPKRAFSLNAFLSGQLFKIIRSSLLLALATVMFILSFFTTTTIKGEDAYTIKGEDAYTFGDALTGIAGAEDLDLDDFLEEIEINITAVDYIEAAFYRLSPKSATKMRDDFQALVEKRTKEIPPARLDDDDEIIEFVCDIFEEFNFLKLLSSKEMTEESPSATLQFWVATGFIFIQMGLSVALVVLAILSLINAVCGKETKDKSVFLLNALSAVTLLSLCGFSNIFGADAGGAVIASLVLSLIALFIFFIERILQKQVVFEGKHLFRYLATATGVLFGILSLTLLCGGLLNAEFDYTNYYATMDYSGSSLIESWDIFRVAENNSTMYGSIQEIFESAVSSRTVELYMNPAYMGVFGNLVIEEKMTAFGILAYCVCTVGTLASAFALVNKVTAFMKGKKTNLFLDILVWVFTVATLVFAAIMSSIAMQATKILETYEYTASLTAGIIFAVIFATLQVAARITFGILDNKKNKATAE